MTFSRLSKLFLPAIVGTLLSVPASAQATSGTTTVGFLVGDPDSAFATALPFPASPTGNPFVEPDHPDRAFVNAQVELGKALFWDEQLSTDNTMACGTCHGFEAGGSELRDSIENEFLKFGSRGVFPQDHDRNFYAEPLLPAGFPPPATQNTHKRTTPLFAPSMVNAAYFEQLFWQKRVGPALKDDTGNEMEGFKEYAALEALSVEPPISPVEMGHDRISWESGKIQDKLKDSTILRLTNPSSVPQDIQYLLGQTTYGDAFHNLYGPSSTDNPVTRERVAMSIAQYMRTLISDQAPILQPGGLTEPELRAFERMRSSSCFLCHSNTNTPRFDPAGGFEDKFDALLSNGEVFTILESPHNMAPDAETGEPIQALMKVPSLLNLGLRRRFFHSGHIEGIDQLLSFFNGELPTEPLVTFIPPLLPIEKEGMRSLWTRGFVDPRLASETFPFDSPDLFSERLAQGGPLENQFGSATFGVRPVLFSSTPATQSDAWFKTGLTHARPNAVSRFGLSSGTNGNSTGLLLDSTVTWSVPMVTDSRGNATWRLDTMTTVPPGIAGMTWVGQWTTQDFQAPAGMAVTRAAVFSLF